MAMHAALVLLVCARWHLKHASMLSVRTCCMTARVLNGF